MVTSVKIDKPRHRYNYFVTVPVTFSIVDSTPLSAISRAIIVVDTNLLMRNKAHGIVSMKITAKEEETGKMYRLVGNEAKEVEP